MTTLMTPSDIREAVRAIMDLPDPDDLSDNLINLYMRDGYNAVLSLERRWRFLETSFSFETISGQRAYDLATIATSPIREVVALVENQNVGVRLDLISYDEGEFKYMGALDVPARPLHFAVWDGHLHLFPKPDGVYTLQGRGYREPIDWILGNTYVDADASLHFPLVYYVVSKVFQHQENTPLALAYKQSFDEAVAIARRDLQRPDSFQPMILSGAGRRARTFDGWLLSLGKGLENYGS